MKTALLFNCVRGKCFTLNLQAINAKASSHDQEASTQSPRPTPKTGDL